jgi:hypothetical protein
MGRAVGDAGRERGGSVSVERAVTRVDRSPLNRRQWCLEMACGHEVWVTSTAKPSRKVARCERCPATPSERADPKGDSDE